MKRLLALVPLLSAALAVPPGPPREYVQAVEFPYYLYPRALWERELVWLKNSGVRTVEFSIPWNWHEVQPGDFDFTGRTSPRRDLAGLVKTLRALHLSAWVRPLPPVRGWIDNGTPAGADARAQRLWLQQLETLLATQTASHGGPIEYVEGRELPIDAAAPPAPVTVIAASDADALARSRAALAAGTPGALLWTGVEDEFYPAGWAADSGPLLHKGAVAIGGEERPAAMTLRRDAALLRNWAPLLPSMHSVAAPKPAEGLAVAEVISPVASAVSVTNGSQRPFHDVLRVLDPISRRAADLPGVSVPAGESLWLPLNMSLGPSGLCPECTNFSAAEHIVYATAELLSIEYENGILAMEFAAPEGGEAVLQLARQPVGPYLAAGKPTEFEWDDKTLRARLRIPPNPDADHRVRIGIAMEEPEMSAFFSDAKRLIVGRKNTVSTAYSSESVAARSRLRLPEGYTATSKVVSPGEIEYEIAVPADALHGDFETLALEADGMLLGRARLQLFRPATVRLMEAIGIHWGGDTELTPDPPTAPAEPKSGSDLEIGVRNNWPAIQTYQLEASGEGLEFFPPRTEVVVGAMEERRVPVRVFARDGVEGLREWHLRVTGAAALDLPMRVVLLPRDRTVAWSADLDGDGAPEWVLETQKVRAVFSSRDGGRWMEFNWKDTNLNFLPEQGAFASAGPVEVHAAGDTLEFTGKGWKRTVRLTGTTLDIDQTTPLAADGLASERRGNVEFRITHPSFNRAEYQLQ